MENKYVIECRYESFTAHGKSFNNWFVVHSVPVTETQGKEKIAEIKKEFGDIDQKTKLKHEYRLRPYTEYENEKTILATTIEEGKKRQQAYLKSDEYKELQQKKRQAAKERKKRQKAYNEAMLEKMAS